MGLWHSVCAVETVSEENARTNAVNGAGNGTREWGTLRKQTMASFSEIALLPRDEALNFHLTNSCRRHQRDMAAKCCRKQSSRARGLFTWVGAPFAGHEARGISFHFCFVFATPINWAFMHWLMSLQSATVAIKVCWWLNVFLLCLFRPSLFGSLHII